MHNLVEKAWTFAGASGLTPVNLAIFAAVLAVYFLLPGLFQKLQQGLSALASIAERHPAAVIVLVALIPVAMRVSLLSEHPIPSPSIHDEFSYLLAADTFAHGRVTNPPHPLFQFFETYHVLSAPAYMSKYPPVQGLLLAAGQVLFGHPWWGVVLSTGLMIAAICWMLMGWLPVSWAALGALATGLQFGVGHAWMNSYWGGAPAAIGACLVLGAFARLKQFRPNAPHPTRNALLFALGIAILLNSRPWEGVAILLPATIAALQWIGKDFAARFRTVLVPAALVLVVTASAMAYYNWRATGNPLAMPYTLVHKTYSVAPLFVWQARTPDPEYRHAVMKRFYLESEPQYQDAYKAATFRGWLSLQPSRLRMAKDLLFGNFFLLLVPLILLNRPAPALRIVGITLAFFMVALALESWNQIHYFGPVIGLAAVLKMSTLQRLSGTVFQGKNIGAALAAGVLLSASAHIFSDSLAFSQVDAFALDRARLQKNLESQPGEHVVLVRYSDTHPPSEEWVYNHADIDSSKVVWAREMQDQENRKLFDYFKGRTFWLLSPDVSVKELKPLTGSEQSALAPHGLNPWQ